MIVPVHNHSEFSAFDGLSRISEIADRCEELGCSCCGLTDHGVVSGHLEFAETLTKRGIKPIFGCELYHGTKTQFERNERDQAHFVVGALNNGGLRNLWRLVDFSSQQDSFRYVGRVNWDALEKHHEGLFATSACLAGLVPEGIRQGDTSDLSRYLNIFGDDFYIELHTYPSDDQKEMNLALTEIGIERGLKFIYADDAHFACNPAEAPIWMADLSFKELGEIEVGDKVVGWNHNEYSRRLCESEVKEIHQYDGAPVVKVTFASGRTLRCTPNHLWRTMSYGGPAGSEYFSEAQVGKNLVHVIDPTPALDPSQEHKANWLGGIFDGEGEGTNNKVGISQSDKNPAVVERICQYLIDLGFTTWKEQEKRPGYDMNRFFIAGGRSEFARFANWTNPAQRHKITTSCFNSRWRTGDRVIAVEPDGVETVYGLTTTTGNYVAWGYASKNSPDQYETHDLYVAKSTGDSIYTPIEDRTMWHPKALYIKSEDEIRDILSYLPNVVVDDAIQNSVELGERIDTQLPEINRHLPLFIPRECKWINKNDYPKGRDAASDLLIDLVETGLEWRYGKNYSDEVFERANNELKIFLEAELEHYFLLAWDVGKFCDANNIERGPGRGSAGGCIVAYALGITDIDPLHYDLIFERFYNAGREKGFPDIDSDFPRESRKIIQQYLKDKWGENRVRQIGTITRLKPKETLNSTYQPCGVTFEEKEAIKDIVENVPDIDILGPDSIGWSEQSDPGKTIYVMDHVGDEIAEWIENQPDSRQEILYEWIILVDTVCSRVEGYGMHPSGIVVSDIDLPEELPCALRGAKGAPLKDKIQATQFPMDDVDKRQFIKLDILGLRTLDTLQEWKDHIDFDIEWSGLELKENNEEMWKLLDKGLSLGVFQVEDGYAKRLCKDFRPRSVEDLAIIGSLNRPGPIRSGAPESFIARRHGYEEVTYDHPILEDILDQTYGWFLYQEQVIAFFNKLGYNLSESDSVRKILGKKKPEQLAALKNGTDEWKDRGFFVMCETADSSLTERGHFVAKFGDRERTFDNRAELIWARLEDFAKYSFNKSHAVAYAVLEFRTLYAKYKRPHEFFIACIKTNPIDAGKYIAEARRMGIEIKPPHILESSAEATIKDNIIYLGFRDVKGVRGAGEYVVTLRDELGYDISTPELLDDALEIESTHHQDTKKAYEQEGKKYKRKSPRSKLKRDQCATLYDVGAWDQLDERDVTLSKKQNLEKELLGVILSDESIQILDNNQDKIEHCDTYDDLYANIDWSEIPFDNRGTKYLTFQIPGIVSHIRTTRTKKDKKDMGIVTIEYEGNDVEFAVFPREWKSFKFLWKERIPGIFTLKRNERGIHFNEGIKLS